MILTAIAAVGGESVVVVSFAAFLVCPIRIGWAAGSIAGGGWAAGSIVGSGWAAGSIPGGGWAAGSING